MSADTTWAKVVSASDYYPFGLTMAGRNYQDSLYRYGFNGKEKDDQGEWGSTNYDYGFRIYNPALGRFLSVDPLADVPKQIGLSPYSAFANNPIIYIDPDGRCFRMVGEEYVPCDNADVGATTTGAFGYNWTMTENNGWQLTNGVDPGTVDAYYTEQTPDGSAAYYENRYTEHIEKYNTRPPDYYLGYGHKYNVRFNKETRAGLSEAGKEWLDQTAIELQVVMENALELKPGLELDNKAFQKFAFESHPGAYATGDNLFKLKMSDKVKIMTTPDFSDSFGSGLGRTQIGKIINMQLQFNSFQSSPSSLYNKTKNPIYLRMGGL